MATTLFMVGQEMIVFRADGVTISSMAEVVTIGLLAVMAMIFLKVELEMIY